MSSADSLESDEAPHHIESYLGLKDLHPQKIYTTKRFG